MAKGVFLIRESMMCEDDFDVKVWCVVAHGVMDSTTMIFLSKDKEIDDNGCLLCAA